MLTSSYENYLVRLVLLTVLIATVGVLKVKAADEYWLTVRLLPNASTETLDLIAECAKPEKFFVGRGEYYKEVIRWYYGASNTKTERLFKNLNPTLDTEGRAERDGEVAFPAGPRWYFKVERDVPSNTTIQQLASFEIGVSGPKTLDDIEGENPTLRGRLTEVGINKVILPYVTRTASYQLKPEWSSPEKRGQIQEWLASDPAVLVKDLLPLSKSKLIKQYELAELNAGEPCTEVPNDNEWAAKAVSLASIKDNSLIGARRVTVAIADSGIITSDPRFNNLWKNIAELGGITSEDDDDNFCFDDIHGCNMTEEGGQGTLFDDLTLTGFTNHGTHVAGLASGRFIKSDYLKGEVDRRIELMILKVVKADSTVPPNAISDAAIYIQNKDVPVVNMSLVTSTSAGIRKQILELEKKTLFVVAAGNGIDAGGGRAGINLDSTTLFPATLSRDLSNVITVGAHNTRGTMPCFSNFGAVSVDLVAPGVEVESTVADDGTFPNGVRKLSGTSQAAPFVTLAAALLVSQGISQPSIVRQRILSTVDFVPDLRGRVSSEGKLNIAKALDIDHDLLEHRQEGLLRGRIISPTMIDIPQEPSGKELRQVRKIIFNYTTNGDKIMSRVALVDAKTARLRYRLVNFDFSTVEFLVEGETAPRTFQTADILDFIPRLLH